MLCRLCLTDDNNYEKLQGAICDMLTAVLRKSFIDTIDPVICVNCLQKIQEAVNFKNEILRTDKILSLYGGSETKAVYVRDNKLCVTNKTINVKLCRTCLQLIEQNFCLNLYARYDIINTLTDYIPEVVISDKEPSLICYKCAESFKMFSEVISMVNNTEKLIDSCCTDKHITNTEEASLDYILYGHNDDLTKDSNIMMLLGDDMMFLDSENESNNPANTSEDPTKKIMQKIIEEDVDQFYKEKPDFDLQENLLADNEMDSDQGNIFFGVPTHQLLIADMEGAFQSKTRYRNVEPPSLRNSFETEESSLSPGALSDAQYYEEEEEDAQEEDEDEKKSERTNSDSNFIFFNDEKCSCQKQSDLLEQTTAQRQMCGKCKWKKIFGIGTSSESRDTDADDEVHVKKPKKDGGKKKCRKAYGIEFKDLWCTQCRWKKACTRFGNNKAVNRR
ncbi:uncharacterized protein [Diabrotica undecimpunctata]|uniref:uncharacterized protein n=1 Tax=Diabrotica undecimpunctata TaxID=50387 RepID=UPI003B64284B